MDSHAREALSHAEQTLLDSMLERWVLGEPIEAPQSAAPLERGLRTGPVPLSFLQEQLWFVNELNPGNPAYNLHSALRLTGPLDVATLERSLQEIVTRHEILRTTFRVEEGRPVQIVGALRGAVLDIEDWTARSGVTKAQIEEWTTRQARRPFDLAAGPAFRASLLRLGLDEHVLVRSMHHIVGDGWSMSVCTREMTALYDAFAAGRPSPLPELPIQYGDFAVWQRARLEGGVLAELLAYWRRQLDGAPPMLDLPADYLRPATQSFSGALEERTVPASLSSGVKDLGRRHGSTLFMTLLAAFSVLLSRFTGQADIVIGTPMAMRNRTELEPLIGFFLNTLVLRTDVSGNPRFGELLDRVRQVTVGAYAHQELPFEKLLEALRPKRDVSHTPLFQVFFNMVSYAHTSAGFSGLTWEPIGRSEVGSKFDLTLYAAERGDGLLLQLVYNSDLFAPARIVAMLDQFQHLLEQVVENPGVRISDISLRASSCRALPDPRERLDAGWLGAIHDLFSAQAVRDPAKAAVVDPRETWSYAELDALSNRLANFLIALGVQRGDVVAIYAARRGSLVWALMGVLKAGAAFLVLDPAYPTARLASYLQQARPRAWIDIGGAEEHPEFVPFIDELATLGSLTAAGVGKDEIAAALGAYPADPPGVTVARDDTAYVAFTSGSTGTPKGILGRHGSLTHFLPWMTAAFEFTSGDRFSLLSGLSHDPLHRDVFTPLALGATIAIPDAADMVPGRMTRWARDAAITVAHLTPAMGRVLTELPQGATVPTLRRAFFVGDVLTVHDVGRLRTVAPNIRVINYYGSTETQRAVGYVRVTGERGPAGAGVRRAKEILPLGHGIQDVQLLVINGAGELAGIGELGEIHVRSPHLAKGYLEDPDLTGQRFLINRFTGDPEDRLYRTGDLGRYLPDGAVEFAGRADGQVKIRGFRIELGEVESVLGRHPSVQECTVIARDEPSGDKQLVAYVVPRGAGALSIGEVRRHVGEALPGYMVPSSFVVLERLPLNPNGKLDRPALPAPGDSRSGGVPFVAPKSVVESAIAAMWRDVLQLEKVGVHDNFFDLGGNSLRMLRIRGRIQEELQRDVAMIELFEHPTISALAAHLRGEHSRREGDGRIDERAARRVKALARQRDLYRARSGR